MLRIFVVAVFGTRPIHHLQVPDRPFLYSSPLLVCNRNLRLHLILCDWVVNPPNAKGYDIYSIRRKQLWELHNKRYTGILRPLLLGSNDFFSLWLVLLLLVHYSVPDVEEEVWDASRTIHSYRRPMLPLADRFEFSVDKG